jgi:hypothetical protein
MTNHTTPKSLTNDEKKAAEAAFNGRPFNSAWSLSARAVYDGIVNALPASTLPALPDLIETETGIAPSYSDSDGSAVVETENVQTGEAEHTEETHSIPTIQDRSQAIQAGILIDVTPTAQQLGLTFPVTITKPLWDIGIVTNQSLPEAEQANRLRDVLMAFRLRLASLTTISPLIDFPALLAMPPSTIPQPVPLFAIIQPDGGNQANVTLLLPNEVSLSITNSN